jgi:hypothetical protein
MDAEQVKTVCDGAAQWMMIRHPNAKEQGVADVIDGLRRRPKR